MPGFIYKENNGVFNLTYFEDMPEGMSNQGEDQNLIVRNYLTDEMGECIPMYQYAGDEETWNNYAMSVKNEGTDPNDGNMMIIMAEEFGITVGEFEIPGRGDVTDGSFQGFSYEELVYALNDAYGNQLQEQTVISPCEAMADADTALPGQKTELAEADTGQVGLTTMKIGG